jgi:hypothetical protein
VVATGEGYSLGLPKGHRQLHQQGTLGAHFQFCVRKMQFPWVPGGATIEYFDGTGTAKVERNASNTVGNPYYEEREPMQLEGTEAWLGPLESRLRVRQRECNYAWSPSRADGPISVEGSLTGDRFDLWLASPETIDFHKSASCQQWDPDYGWSDGGRYSQAELVPLFQTSRLTVLPLERQNWTIAARDGASEE